MGCAASTAGNVKSHRMHTIDEVTILNDNKTLLQQRLPSGSSASSYKPSGRNATVDDKLAIQMRREELAIQSLHTPHEDAATKSWRTMSLMKFGDAILEGRLSDRPALLEDDIANEFRARGVDEWAIPLFVADQTGSQPAIQVEVDAQGVGCIQIPVDWKTGDAILIAMPGDEYGPWAEVWKHVITLPLVKPPTLCKTSCAKAGEIMRVPMHQLKLAVWCANANTHIRTHTHSSPSSAS